MNFKVSRAEAINKLDHFIENNLLDYSKLRNFDFGPEKRGNTSCLSPYVAHGLVNETEIINKSLKKANGEYFIVLHSGDFFYSKHSLSILSKSIDKNKNYDFYYSNILFYNQINKNVSRVWKISSKNDDKLNFLKIAHTSLCIKKHIPNKIFYDEKFKISADMDYLFKLSQNFKGKYFNNFFIYMEDQGLSNSKKYFFIKLKEDFEILYKRFNIFFLFILIYKLSIKIPGILTKKNIYNKNYINEKNKLI